MLLRGVNKPPYPNSDVSYTDLSASVDSGMLVGAALPCWHRVFTRCATVAQLQPSSVDKLLDCLKACSAH